MDLVCLFPILGLSWSKLRMTPSPCGVLCSIQSMSRDLNRIFLLNRPKFNVNENVIGKSLLKGKCDDGLYFIDNSNDNVAHALFACSSKNNSSLGIWHIRCGHPSSFVLSKLLNNLKINSFKTSILSIDVLTVL